MARISVLVPCVPRRPEQTLPYAGLVSWTSASRLWQGQSLIVEPYQSLVYAAGAGLRVPTGLGVGLMPLRHPYEAALQARSLARCTGHSVVAGFGPGGRTFQQQVLGAPYARPLVAVREYTTIVRRLLNSEHVRFEGEYFRCEVGLADYPSPPVEVGLGVLRPGMARLAGELADVAITWLTPPKYLADVIAPALLEGAVAGGRPVPRMAAMVPVALAEDGRDAVRIVSAGCGTHLQADHYRDMLTRAGIDLSRSDPDTDAKALVAGGAFVWGTAAEVLGQLSEYVRAGVDELILNVTGVYNTLGPDAASADLRSLLQLASPLMNDGRMS